jgi:hypothetical protein
MKHLFAAWTRYHSISFSTTRNLTEEANLTGQATRIPIRRDPSFNELEENFPKTKFQIWLLIISKKNHHAMHLQFPQCDIAFFLL